MFDQKTKNAGHPGKRRAGRVGTPFFRSLGLAGGALALCLVALPASASWWSSSPGVSVGSKTINVRNAGARGDGRHDDTSAFQAAINALPSSGGTITVPAGTYMINTLRSINLRSHVHLKMSSGARLVAIPNSSTRYYLIKAWRAQDVEISGGQLIGDRDRHRGSRGEWGYGISIMASDDVFVHDVKVSDFWGDGLYIGAIGHPGSADPSTDVTLNRVVSTNNRRQGLSFGPVDRVYVVNSTFSNTHGTAPEDGIDIEPRRQGTARNIRIENSTMTGNAGNGLEMSEHVTGVVVTSNTISSNKGSGVYVGGMSNFWITANAVEKNGFDGIVMRTSTNNGKITGNKVMYNSTAWFIRNHRSIYSKTSSARDMQISPTTWSIAAAGNRLSPTR